MGGVGSSQCGDVLYPGEGRVKLIVKLGNEKRAEARPKRGGKPLIIAGRSVRKGGGGRVTGAEAGEKPYRPIGEPSIPPDWPHVGDYSEKKMKVELSDSKKRKSYAKTEREDRPSAATV